MVRYNEYINSWQWRIKATIAKWLNPRCSLCFHKGNLNVHHRTYERLGHEKWSDLVVLCRACHEIFHKFYEYKDGRFRLKRTTIRRRKR